MYAPLYSKESQAGPPEAAGEPSHLNRLRSKTLQREHNSAFMDNLFNFITHDQQLNFRG